MPAAFFFPIATEVQGAPGGSSAPHARGALAGWPGGRSGNDAGSLGLNAPTTVTAPSGRARLTVRPLGGGAVRPGRAGVHRHFSDAAASAAALRAVGFASPTAHDPSAIDESQVTGRERVVA